MQEHHSTLLKNHGFVLLKSVPVAFTHEGKDMSGVVRGDDFAWERTDEDMDCVLKVLGGKYELKNRGRQGFGPKGVRKIDMLGRIIELTQEGITWQGDPRHFDLLKEYFGTDDNSKGLSKKGCEDDLEQEAARDRVVDRGGQGVPG